MSVSNEILEGLNAEAERKREEKKEVRAQIRTLNRQAEALDQEIAAIQEAIKVLGGGPAPRKRGRPSEREQIKARAIEVLEAHGGSVFQHDLRDEVGVSDSGLRRALEEMILDGLIKRERRAARRGEGKGARVEIALVNGS